MVKKIVCASVGVFVLTAAAAEVARPRSELVASVEFAPFSDFQQKVVSLGAAINNPVVPTLAVPAVQNYMTEQFGQFRSDAPMRLMFYADVASFRKALADEAAAALEDCMVPVFLYPSAEGADKFMVNHPEAQKKPEGVIELEDGSVAVFSGDGRTCAFAPDAASAKRALASGAVSDSAKRPLLRVDVTETGIGMLADLQLKVSEEQGRSLEEMTKAVSSNETGYVASFVKFQQSQTRRQHAMLLSFAQATLSLDLDDTGFVTKASAKAKGGAQLSPAAGFRLPPAVLDGMPEGSPLFCAVNAFLGMDVRNEQEYRSMLEAMRALTDGAFAEIRKSNSAHAPTIDGLRIAFADLFSSMPYPGPADWGVYALAFGPGNVPYMVQRGECAKAAEGHSVAVRFYAAVAAALGKAWPGVMCAEGARLVVDWNRVIDLATESCDAKKQNVQNAESVKKVVASVLGASKSEVSTTMPSPTTYRTYAGPVGFVPPAAKPSGESRLAAALPETVGDRPSGVFYMSLYSMLRDNVLPIVLKALPKEEAAEAKALAGVLPPAGANGAIAGAAWVDKDGSCRFVMRVTMDEIKSMGAAFNAVVAAQMAE